LRDAKAPDEWRICTCRVTARPRGAARFVVASIDHRFATNPKLTGRAVACVPPPRRLQCELPTLVPAIHPRASQHPRTSSGLTLWRLFRQDRISSSRTCEVQIPRDRARCAQGSCEVGTLSSEVSELRAVGLQLGNRSLHSTHWSGGSRTLSVTGSCRSGPAIRQHNLRNLGVAGQYCSLS
jgi:hypothetical protein